LAVEITKAQLGLLAHLARYGEAGDTIGDARQVRSRLVAKGLVEDSGEIWRGIKKWRLTVAGRAVIQK
jgi:hypothetical protein